MSQKSQKKQGSFLLAKTPSNNKYCKNRQSNKRNKIKDLEREKAKNGSKSPQMSQKSQK